MARSYLAGLRARDSKDIELRITADAFRDAAQQPLFEAGAAMGTDDYEVDLRDFGIIIYSHPRFGVRLPHLLGTCFDTVTSLYIPWL